MNEVLDQKFGIIWMMGPGLLHSMSLQFHTWNEGGIGRHLPLTLISLAPHWLDPSLASEFTGLEISAMKITP